MAVSNRDVEAVQRCYPKIYVACHTLHQRRRSNAAQLTANESSLLAHLDVHVSVRPSKLAAHLGIGRSTVSAAIRRLSRLGYIVREDDLADARVRGVRLSTLGA